MRIELPERAVWPLPPRPLVLPWPLDSPWPRRFRRCLAPGRGFRSCNRIVETWCVVRGAWCVKQAYLDYGRFSGRSGGWRRRGFNFLDLHAAASVNVFAEAQAEQSLQRGFDHIGGIFRAERLAQDIFHAS